MKAIRYLRLREGEGGGKLEKWGTKDKYRFEAREEQ